MQKRETINKDIGWEVMTHLVYDIFREVRPSSVAMGLIHVNRRDLHFYRANWSIVLSLMVHIISLMFFY